MRAVTAEQKTQIMKLAKDFPRLWSSPTTTSKDRKRILRLLVQDIVVSKSPEPKIVNLTFAGKGVRTKPSTSAYPRTKPTPFATRQSLSTTSAHSP